MLPARDYAIYVSTSVLAAGAGLGMYYLLRGKVREQQQKTVQEEGLREGTAANWAKRLKMAFDNDMAWGMGTDEAAVYKVFTELPTKKAYIEVQKAYRTLYQKDLNAVLQDELSSSEFARVMRIYNAKK